MLTRIFVPTGLMVLAILVASNAQADDLFGQGAGPGTGAAGISPRQPISPARVVVPPGSSSQGPFSGGAFGGSGSSASSSFGSGSGTSGSSLPAQSGRASLSADASRAVGALKSKIAATDDDLFQQWKERELARYAYTHTGLPQERARFEAAQRNIEALQRNRLKLIGQLGKEIMASNPEQSEKVKSALAKAKASANATFGLQSDKFVNPDWNNIPFAPKDIEKWITSAR